MKRTITLLSSLALALAACGQDEQEPADQPLSIATSAAGGYTVELLADRSLGVGLNDLSIKVTTAGGARVTDAAVTFEPLMDMGTMTHSCPVFGGPVAGTDGLYHGHAVFQMASGMAGTWSATVGVTPAGGSRLDASFADLQVADRGEAKTFTSGMSKYVLALDFKAPPRVGLNPVVVTLHETQDMGMTFTPVNDATFVLDPQMPSMGHGSPGSVNPTLVSDGWYEGQLSFSMTGAWETTITASRPGVSPLGSVMIATTF
jgi:hypothetical protein